LYLSLCSETERGTGENKGMREREREREREIFCDSVIVWGAACPEEQAFHEQ
jgi:hypothetical protein